MKELTDAELVTLIDKAIMKFRGNGDELENAIGAFMLGRKMGWRPLFLIHSPKSIKKYEAILSIDFREVMPEVGPKAKNSVAWKVAQTVTNFWKLVKGETPNVKTDDWKHI
ncbi:hypothetical protein F8A87_12385 [Betaproteobacteria bacterium SCN2]|nr:hypothetical protein F8A87_12385 [Betaproteobacteria bacterium SCN2]